MNIIERAKEHANRFNRENDAHEYSYSSGANDQHAIDVNAAWKWIEEACSKYPIQKEELPVMKLSFEEAMGRATDEEYMTFQEVVDNLIKINTDQGSVSTAMELELENGYTCSVTVKRRE